MKFFGERLYKNSHAKDERKEREEWAERTTKTFWRLS